MTREKTSEQEQIKTFGIKVKGFKTDNQKIDNDKAPDRSAKGIQVIFIGVSKNNPEKAIVVVQALEGVLGKNIQENIEIFEKMVQS